MKKECFEFWRMVLGCFILAFLSAFVWIGSNALFAPSLKGYETVPCRIVKSSVKMETVDCFVFSAEFAYERFGKTYKSNFLCRPDTDEFVFGRLACRLPLLEKYAPGTDHECLINPANPVDAVLAVENPVEAAAALSRNIVLIVAGMALLLFLFAGVFMVASAFPSVRRLGTPRVKKLLTAVFLVLFGCPFLSIGSFELVRHVREWTDLKSYMTVPAKILYSGMYSSHSDRGRMAYGVRVGYEYAIDGKTYESDRLAISQFASNNYDHQRYLASRYKKGDTVTAYVSSDDPRKSLLEKTRGLGDIGALGMTGLFVAVGFAILGVGTWMLLSLLRRRNGTPLSFEGRILRRSRGDLLMLGLFVGIWNWFSWSFVLVFVGEEQVRRLEPALLAPAIFPVAGLFFIGIFIRKLARERRAPRLEMALSCAMWKHGSYAKVDWSLESQAEVKSLEILLERTRLEGSGKYSRQVTVSSQSCCRHVHPMIPDSGSFDFTIPGEADDGCRLSFAVKITVKSIRRAFKLDYPLPKLYA